MIKLILNNNEENILLVNNFNYFASLQIANYSNRSDNIDFSIAAESLDDVAAFEDTPITSIKITKEDNTLIANLSFEGDNLYVLNYNTNIYSEDSINSQVNIGRVNIPNENSTEQV